jgi:hypothetical protein
MFASIPPDDTNLEPEEMTRFIELLLNPWFFWANTLGPCQEETADGETIAVTMWAVPWTYTGHYRTVDGQKSTCGSGKAERDDIDAVSQGTFNNNLAYGRYHYT